MVGAEWLGLERPWLLELIPLPQSGLGPQGKSPFRLTGPKQRMRKLAAFLDVVPPKSFTNRGSRE